MTMNHLRGLDEDLANSGVFGCWSDRGRVWEVNRSKAEFGSEAKIVVSGISIREGVTLSEEACQRHICKSQQWNDDGTASLSGARCWCGKSATGPMGEYQLLPKTTSRDL